METPNIAEQPSELELLMQAEIAKLRAENEALHNKANAQSGNGIQLRISEKKALSVYGLGRFPVTLYKTQWVKLLGVVPEIQAFLKVNDSKLAEKSAKE